jgi:hypothetical protein
LNSFPTIGGDYQWIAIQKSDRVYSSGYCSGFTPDSLLSLSSKDKNAPFDCKYNYSLLRKYYFTRIF